METLLNLFFELSNDARMNIVTKLAERPMKLTGLSRELELPAQEISRQLSRLYKTLLIRKDSEGLYHLTSYGELALRQLSGLGFVSYNREYFLEHSTSNLPYKFVSRIGELSLALLNKDVLASIAYAELVLQQAEEYCWSLTDQVIASSSAIIEEKIKLGVKFRSILPEKLVSPPGYNPAYSVERRTLPKIELRVLVTEKEAMFGLSYLNGQMDYAQFVSKDSKFHEWCKDLYLFYWEKAKPVISFPSI